MEIPAAKGRAGGRKRDERDKDGKRDFDGTMTRSCQFFFFNTGFLVAHNR